MSGAGYKNFGSEVLTSSDVDTYLMEQTVMVFADAAARNTALASPAEGMHAFLKDSNTVTYYDGAAWKTLPGGVTTAGDVIYFDGTSWQRLGIGTADQVLAVNSGATAPEWTAAAAGAHIEAKDTAASGPSESVTWTTAFASTPVVTVSIFQRASAYLQVTARSTTGASVNSSVNTGDVKMVMAMEAT